jgi:hypothetical protein
MIFNEIYLRISQRNNKELSQASLKERFASLKPW